MSVVITEECNVMVNSGELFGTTEYLMLLTRCRINQCRYNRVYLYMKHEHDFYTNKWNKNIKM